MGLKKRKKRDKLS